MTHYSKRARKKNMLLLVVALVVVIIVGALFAVVFLAGANQSAAKPNPVITDTYEGTDNWGVTYRLSVSVQNNGSSGMIKVYAEVKVNQNGTVSFAQTQDKSVYLDAGNVTTLVFDFTTGLTKGSEISKRVWATAP
jgi:hypothetical protein